MSAATAIAVFLKSEFGPQFTYGAVGSATQKTWNIKTVSGDAGNLISAGSDGLTAYLNQATVRATQAVPSIVHDTPNNQLIFDNGLGVKTNIPVAFTSATVSSASLTGTVLTLQETNGGGTVSLDLGAFIQSIQSTNTAAILVSGTGHDANNPLTVSLLLDSTANSIAGYTNMMKIKSTGVVVDPADIVTLMNAKTTVSMTATAASGVHTIVVNGQTTSLPIVQLTDTQGNPLGLAFAPA